MQHSVLIIAMLLVGCAATEPIVYLSAPAHRVNEYTIAEFYTPEELDQRVRLWAVQSEIAFDFNGKRARVVVPQDKSHLAEVWYSGGMGEKFLSVTFNYDGQIVDQRLAVGACGTME